jgi:predicted small secreted protein
VARFLQIELAGMAREERIKTMKSLGIVLPLVSVAALTLLTAACNTVEGVGRDLERAGDAIQDEADDTRDRRRNN